MTTVKEFIKFLKKIDPDTTVEVLKLTYIGYECDYYSFQELDLTSGNPNFELLQGTLYLGEH